MAKDSCLIPDETGPQCRRCGAETAVFGHRSPPPTDKPYYSRWYRCMNKRCRTTLIMPEEFKVYPDSTAEETTSVHRDIALEILPDMSIDRTRPPWE